jgi:hypothetical protein
MDAVRPARHDLLTGDYAFGAIQTTRGCAMNCTFCSVTTFNGAQYRQRSIPELVREFRSIRECRVLIVDDNLIGTRPEHIARAKELFHALAAANLGKSWIAQAMINFGDDEELLTLAAKAGCAGVFIGFESPTTVTEVGKRFNLSKGRSLAASVARIQHHHILVVGSFIIGLDADTAGIGRRTAEAARQYRVDALNTLFLTPLPGTRVWDQMTAEDHLALDRFPEDWKYFTLTFPVARYKHLSRDEAIDEMLACDGHFYAMPRILGRLWKNVSQRRQPLISLCGNLSFRRNLRLNRKAYADFSRDCARSPGDSRPTSPAVDRGVIRFAISSRSLTTSTGGVPRTRIPTGISRTANSRNTPSSRRPSILREALLPRPTVTVTTREPHDRLATFF